MLIVLMYYHLKNYMQLRHMYLGLLNCEALELINQLKLQKKLYQYACTNWELFAINFHLKIFI